MEEDSFSRLGEDIISVVQLAAEGQWSKAKELHERVTTQVTCRLEEGLENLRPTQRKKLRQSRQRFEHLLTSVLTVEGRWTQAETLLRELLQLARRRLTQVASEAEVIDMVKSSTQLATLLQRKGKLQEGEKLHEDASQILCTRLNNMANVLQEQGKWQKAEEMHTEVLEGMVRVLKSMNNLATVLQEQGKWQKAEEMHTEVLEGMVRFLGQDHQDTLSSMNNLATVLQEQGKWQIAEEMHTEVLEARRRVLKSMNNLATVLQEQGKWQKAEEMHTEVLEARRRVLGQDHQGTLSSMNNLATVLQEQGKWQKAEEMHAEVLEARRRVLGQDHQDTLSSMSNLATVLQEQGKWQKAEEMHTEVLEARRRVLGQDHQRTLSSMNNLANVLKKQGKWQKAEEMHTEVLEAKRRVLGQDHQDTLSSMNNLANVLQEQGKWQKAEEMHTEVLEARRRVLGQDHQDTLSSMNNLSYVVSARDREDWQFRFSLKDDSHRSRLEDAKEKVRKAVDALKLRVDADHPDLLRRRMLLAELLVQTNEPSSLQEAVDLLRQVVPACSDRYGPEHRWTQKAMMNLVFLLEELGKTKEAEEWQQRVVQVENDAETTNLQYLARVDEDAAEGLDDLAWVQDVLRHKQQMIWARYRAVGSSNQSASQACSAQANAESSDAPVASAAAVASQASNQSCLCPPSCESTDGASSDSWAEWKAAHKEMARTRTQAS